MALLADLETARKKHGATRVYAARVLLRAAAAVATGPLRRSRINTARTALKGMK